MSQEKINFKKLVDYWQKGSEHDWQTAKSLKKSLRYDACLFFCHLTLEKYLKSMIVITTKQHAPYTHNLVELAQKINLDLDEKQLEYLARINEFNLACRYPDYKYNFYKRCSKSFTNKYFKITGELLIWLKKYRLQK